MRLWALATSPHGLGLTSEAFWSLTWREFDALREVYDEPRERWAIEMSMLANVHFREPGAAAWMPDDFLGRGDRTARSIHNAIEKFEVTKLNRKLAMRKPGDKTGLPDWAVN